MKINWTYIIGGLVVLIIAFFLGWFAKPSEVFSVEVKKKNIYDTLKTEHEITGDTTKIVNKYKGQIQKLKQELAEKIDTNKNFKDIRTDSLEINEDKAKIKISHTTIGLDSSFISTWDYDIKWIEESFNTLTKLDSIKTITLVKYTNKPFFLDEWFWLATIELIGMIIITIFAVI